jgi:hypothetical protein
VIGEYLSYKNKSAIVEKKQKFYELGTPSVCAPELPCAPTAADDD